MPVSDSPTAATVGTGEPTVVNVQSARSSKIGTVVRVAVQSVANLMVAKIFPVPATSPVQSNPATHSESALAAPRISVETGGHQSKSRLIRDIAGSERTADRGPGRTLFVSPRSHVTYTVPQLNTSKTNSGD
ncbi:hypothetical protein K438DRAFT_1768665 [Mycena galopus ATCC 62051]|nr:hypothetical protein K438DRAFT_1768665 [Mycena galopus ATCC 62051]